MKLILVIWVNFKISFFEKNSFLFDNINTTDFWNYLLQIYFCKNSKINFWKLRGRWRKSYNHWRGMCCSWLLLIFIFMNIFSFQCIRLNYRFFKILSSLIFVLFKNTIRKFYYFFILRHQKTLIRHHNLPFETSLKDHKTVNKLLIYH